MTRYQDAGPLSTGQPGAGVMSTPACGAASPAAEIGAGGYQPGILTGSHLSDAPDRGWARGRYDPQVARGMRRIRLERGWTLRDMGAVLGGGPSRISRIENGQRGTPFPALTARMLGVPLSYLMASCPQCDYQPPLGYQCLRCGTHATHQEALPGTCGTEET